jgi:peptidoglycan biosynthesis protein MviN/MurJ (putative lipid II flippase)
LAALVAWAAASLEDQPPSQSIDPQHAGVATAGAFAACFCIVALWRLRKASRGRGWLGASVWLAVAIIALFVVVLVAFASRLGG